ncbi:MAG: hypothetical protein PVF51_00160 [Nitrospirota bacterium]|jgi:hypothetical protein
MTILDRRGSWSGAATALLFGVVLSAPVPGDAGSCADCHRQLKQDPKWAHTYQDWAESMHAYNDVTCVTCHGGDGEATLASAAHVGIHFVWAEERVHAGDRLVLSQGCGQCHPNQIRGALASAHFRALQEGREAADCTTCHGAVGGQVLNSDTITTTCRRCHHDEKPGNTVEVARTLLEYTRRVRMALVFPEAGKQLRGSDRDQVMEAITASMAAWHQFDLEAVGVALAHGTGVLEK